MKFENGTSVNNSPDGQWSMVSQCGNESATQLKAEIRLSIVISSQMSIFYGLFGSTNNNT